MRAIGHTIGGTSEVLHEIDTSDPVAGPRDLLVSVRAISVNPVDTKVRANDPPGLRILGWDVAGVVVSVGAEVTMFKPGDEVWYAGDITREGANSELHIVDERIVADKPTTINFEAAAAMPLTSITAWEMLFDRLGVAPGSGEGDTIVIIGAAGGVGSMLVQLARQLTKLRVIGTASRPETVEWVKRMGAHDVVDHRLGVAAEVRKLGVRSARYVVGLTHSTEHWPDICDIVAPQGAVGLIDDPGLLDMGRLKQKSVSFHWEFMFTRSMYQTEDMDKQHRLLSKIASLVDSGTIASTVTERLGIISATNVRLAHEMLESGRTCGKVVMAGWQGTP